MNIAYLVHDLGDPAVERRVSVFQRGGAAVRLYGFARGGRTTPKHIAGVTPIQLSLSRDGQLMGRAVSLLRHSLTSPGWARKMADADLVIARNLDNLALALTVKRCLGLKAPLLYELLDVHTVMFADRLISRLLRSLEGHLLNASAGVIISSPAFEREYLARHHRHLPQVLLVENKVLSSHIAAQGKLSAGGGPPWRIGWFGAIRCRESLEMLSALLKQSPGLFEVDIRGRFVDLAMGDALEVIKSTKGMIYHGPYGFDDLCSIYADVHFVWTIDLCQAGANSDWLLPNRLYEGSLHGAVPIAQRGVETGRWLADRGLGFLVDLPLGESLLTLLTNMTAHAYNDASLKLSNVDRSLFEWTDAEAIRLVERLRASIEAFHR